MNKRPYRSLHYACIAVAMEHQVAIDSYFTPSLSCRLGTGYTLHTFLSNSCSSLAFLASCSCCLEFSVRSRQPSFSSWLRSASAFSARLDSDSSCKILVITTAAGHQLLGERWEAEESSLNLLWPYGPFCEPEPNIALALSLSRRHTSAVGHNYTGAVHRLSYLFSEAVHSTRRNLHLTLELCDEVVLVCLGIELKE